MKFFKNLIQKHIEKLEGEREGMLRMLKVYPKDSFCYDTLNCNLKRLDFKITIWEALM